MVAAIQTFGDIVNWHPHIHALVTEGGFTAGGHFVPIPDIDPKFCLALWQENVFDFLIRGEGHPADSHALRALEGGAGKAAPCAIVSGTGSPQTEDAGDYMPEYDVFEDGGQTE